MRTILRLSVENFLSFQKADVNLQALNVLVGPNRCGKTNFLRVFQFIGDVARRDLVPAIDALGGYEAIRFHGVENSRDRQIKFSLSALITDNASANAPDEYQLSFWERRLRTPAQTPEHLRRVIGRSETIALKRTRGRGRRITLRGGSVNFAPLGTTSTQRNVDKKLTVQADSSGLSTIRKLGDRYGASQVRALADVFESLRLYEVDVDKARMPSRKEDSAKLADNASNIASYLYSLSTQFPDIFERLCEDVRYILPSFISFEFAVLGGSLDSVGVYLREQHLDSPTPLGRASFGTIRAIALFAMLHDPSPPRLTCLEEIDHGLHPHALDRLVERLREASSKTQIILATHSPALVNRFTPEDLVIFERDQQTGGTKIVELDGQQIREMQQKSGFSLGELWFSGSLGGGL
jgi:predicted ATPase